MTMSFKNFEFLSWRRSNRGLRTTISRDLSLLNMYSEDTCYTNSSLLLMVDSYDKRSVSCHVMQSCHGSGITSTGGEPSNMSVEGQNKNRRLNCRDEAQLLMQSFGAEKASSSTKIAGASVCCATPEESDSRTAEKLIKQCTLQLQSDKDSQDTNIVTPGAPPEEPRSCDFCPLITGALPLKLSEPTALKPNPSKLSCKCICKKQSTDLKTTSSMTERTSSDACPQPAENTDTALKQTKSDASKGFSLTKKNLSNVGLKITQAPLKKTGSRIDSKPSKTESTTQTHIASAESSSSSAKLKNKKDKNNHECSSNEPKLDSTVQEPKKGESLGFILPVISSSCQCDDSADELAKPMDPSLRSIGMSTPATPIHMPSTNIPCPNPCLGPMPAPRPVTPKASPCAMRLPTPEPRPETPMPPHPSTCPSLKTETPPSPPTPPSSTKPVGPKPGPERPRVVGIKLQNRGTAPGPSTSFAAQALDTKPGTLESFPISEKQSKDFKSVTCCTSAKLKKSIGTGPEECKICVSKSGDALGPCCATTGTEQYKVELPSTNTGPDERRADDLSAYSTREPCFTSSQRIESKTELRNTGTASCECYVDTLGPCCTSTGPTELNARDYEELGPCSTNSPPIKSQIESCTVPAEHKADATTLCECDEPKVETRDTGICPDESDAENKKTCSDSACSSFSKRRIDAISSEPASSLCWAFLTCKGSGNSKPDGDVYTINDAHQVQSCCKKSCCPSNELLSKISQTKACCKNPCCSNTQANNNQTKSCCKSPSSPSKDVQPSDIQTTPSSKKPCRPSNDLQESVKQATKCCSKASCPNNQVTTCCNKSCCPSNNPPIIHIETKSSIKTPRCKNATPTRSHIKGNENQSTTCSKPCCASHHAPLSNNQTNTNFKKQFSNKSSAHSSPGKQANKQECINQGTSYSSNPCSSSDDELTIEIETESSTTSSCLSDGSQLTEKCSASVQYSLQKINNDLCYCPNNPVPDKGLPSQHSQKNVSQGLGLKIEPSKLLPSGQASQPVSPCGIRQPCPPPPAYCPAGLRSYQSIQELGSFVSCECTEKAERDLKRLMSKLKQIKKRTHGHSRALRAHSTIQDTCQSQIPKSTNVKGVCKPIKPGITRSPVKLKKPSSYKGDQSGVISMEEYEINKKKKKKTKMLCTEISVPVMEKENICDGKSATSRSPSATCECPPSRSVSIEKFKGFKVVVKAKVAASTPKLPPCCSYSKLK